jgi:erythritol kinase (D-erythritol 1-phosphate-forming)
MSRDILIGIDAGTSVIKSVAFDLSGRQIASAALPNHYETLADGGVEQDMARTWLDTARTLRDLATKVPDLAHRTAALSVTGQGDGTWLVDDDGEPVVPAWLWLDGRAATIAEEFIGSERYPAHYERTGTGVNACQQSIHLAWLARHRPGVLERAASAHHCKDWLYFKLTGIRATDPSEGTFTFGRFETRSYAPDNLDDLGASEAKRLLPPMVEGTETSHPLGAAAAAASSLSEGTPVVLGYVDVMCTALGGGLYDPKGRVGCTIVGSTGMHMRLAPSASAVKLNPDMTGYTMPFPVPGMYAQMQSNMASTLNIDWLLDLARDVLEEAGIEKTRAALLAGLDESVMARPPGRLLYHPYISQAGERGPFMDPAARAQFTGLDRSMGYHDLMRSVFEGLCFAARDCYSAMGNIPSEVRITGGAARSQALRQMLASVLKANIRTLTREEAGAAGAAMMAAVQQKIYPDMAACVAEWVDPYLGPAVEPANELTRVYDRVFELYQQTRRGMGPIWRGLAKARCGAGHAA